MTDEQPAPRLDPDSEADVAEARRVLKELDRRSWAESHEREEALRAAWRAECVGRRFKVDVDAVERWGDQSYSVEFEARLIEADQNEGEMRWDNGVVTHGVWLMGKDALPEP